MSKVKSNERVKLYIDDDHIVVAPLTHRASCKYGANSKWCTSVVSDSTAWDDTIKKGALVYIIMRKSDLKYAIYYDYIGEYWRPYNISNDEMKISEFEWLSLKIKTVIALYFASCKKSYQQNVKEQISKIKVLEKALDFKGVI